MRLEQFRLHNSPGYHCPVMVVKSTKKIYSALDCMLTPVDSGQTMVIGALSRISYLEIIDGMP
jgi:hypothetical protein